MNFKEEASERIIEMKNEMTNSCFKTGAITFMLVVLMINFNGFMPKATAEMYYDYPSVKNIISIDVVNNVQVIAIMVVTVVILIVTQDAAFLSQ